MFFLKYLPMQALIANYSGHYPAGAEPRIADKLQLLREASVLLRELEEYFREHDFSITRFLICVSLDQAKDGLTHSQIVERIDVSSPVISRSLKALVDEGLVEIVVDDENARIRRQCLTEMGRERLTSLLPGYYQILLASSERETE
ncbi:MAG: MarR family transcriptional regulator [Ponticaulis sp.]|nr:MarR family transcriptional regulator [Ponticaulis sp.]|tara:strand:- start:16637 stop:17074 length:438 start_codon:yes stop_codon:yes gene_type:complete